MTKLIRNYTVKEANRECVEKEWTCSVDEIDGIIGLMIICGATGNSKMESEELWSKDWGLQVFKDTMSCNRYREISRYLRFDDKQSRSFRLKTDKFGMISEVWDRFVQNSQSCYQLIKT